MSQRSFPESSWEPTATFAVAKALKGLALLGFVYFSSWAPLPPKKGLLETGVGGLGWRVQFPRGFFLFCSV